MSSPATRSSGRRRQVNKRYTVDAFEGIPELQDSDDDSTAKPVSEDDDDEDDFQAAAEASPELEEDGLSLEGDIDEVNSNNASDVGENDLDDAISIANSDLEPQDIAPGRRTLGTLVPKGQKRRKKNNGEGVRLYTRGSIDITTNNAASKGNRQKYYFGPSAADYAPVHKARSRWAFEPTLPSRKPNKDGLGGLHHSFTRTEEQRTADAAVGWDWYYNQNGMAALRERQFMREIPTEEGRAYMPPQQQTDFLMGPYKQQQLFTLSVGNGIPLPIAWPEASASRKAYKKGYILNLGAKVSNVDWAPSRSDSRQFFAVSVLLKRDAESNPNERHFAPAFTPQHPHKASIQIWECAADKNGYIDTDLPPRLRLVLCTAWGDVKTFKWCPMPRPAQDDDSLGLFAGVWGDGGMRVLDVPMPESGDSTQYLCIEKASSSRPPDTLCTCLTWLSPSSLAAGCSNGCIAVWDIPNALLSASSTGTARPKIFTSISNTYILAITSAYPSHPNLLMTSSMSGYIYLTDLSHPQPASPAATVSSQRTRVGQTTLTWSDYCQCALSVDDNYILRAYSPRRWFSVLGVGRFKAAATCFAVSPCHPFLLAGTTRGDVAGVNPVRKLCSGRVTAWTQTWFLHEWRRAHEVNPEDTVEGAVESTLEDEQPSTTAPTSEGLYKKSHQPMARITEGYKADKTLLKDPTTESSAGTKPTKMMKTTNGGIAAVVYEEGTAITALSWNPNMCCGGWAAAGMGDGLLRIEDIAS